MTTSLPHTHIRLRDLSELIAGIPYVIGFPPTDSLVLFTFRRCPDLALSTTIRVDLPKPEHFSLIVAGLTNAVAINEAVAVIAVAVGESAEEHGQLIESLRKSLSDKGILLSHASWVDRVVHGEQWQCYDDPLCTGIVPDPQTSALAAACAVAGDTTYPNREAIAAHLAPDEEEPLAIRRKLLDAYRMSRPRLYTDADRDADLELLGLALDMALTSYESPALTDDQVARLGIALSQTPIKDECLAIALSDEREPAERLWTVLVRALPVPERAEPAFLLAMSAYLRGAGVMAALALSIVMESDPLHRTGVLLDFALRMGIPPDQLRSLLMTSILKNDEMDADSTAVEDDEPPWDTSAEPLAAAEPPFPEERTTDSTVPPAHTIWPTHGPSGFGPVNDSNTSPANPLDGASKVSTTYEWPADPRTTRPAAGTPTFGRQVPTSFSGTPWMPTSEGDVASTGPASGDISMYREASTAHGHVSESHDEPGGPLDDRTENADARIAPGPLSQQAAVALGVRVDEPVTRTVTMDALTAFLPPPTDRSGPG